MKRQHPWAPFIVGAGLAFLLGGLGIAVGVASEKNADHREVNINARHKTYINCDQFEVSRIMQCVNGKTESVIVEFRIDNKGCPSDDSCIADWVPDEDGEGGHFEITEDAP